MRDLGAVAVGAIERNGEFLVELGTVAGHAVADAVKYVDRQAFGVGGRLQHHRRHRADQHCPGDAPGPVAADVARHFAAAGGVADHRDVLQV
ncbi:hypothetical protein D3C72_1747030 [compost metagenome]